MAAFSLHKYVHVLVEEYDKYVYYIYVARPGAFCNESIRNFLEIHIDVMRFVCALYISKYVCSSCIYGNTTGFRVSDFQIKSYTHAVGQHTFSD